MKKNKHATGAKASQDALAQLDTTHAPALLQALHILTREGNLNQDSRRKLKQVNHLTQFITPLLHTLLSQQAHISLVDHGAGKSYLGFLLYDLFFKNLPADKSAQVLSIETRAELVEKSQQLAQQLGFDGMTFLNLSVAQAIQASQVPTRVDVVTALHACDTATDDAIAFALKKQAQAIVLVPCCQAEVARELSLNRAQNNQRQHLSSDENEAANPLAELWRRPLHTREFGSQLTNVLRCLQLEAQGYAVTVTELVGWEHSMKNELILAQKIAQADAPHNKQMALQKTAQAQQRLEAILNQVGLKSTRARFLGMMG